MIPITDVFLKSHVEFIVIVSHIHDSKCLFELLLVDTEISAEMVPLWG